MQRASVVQSASHLGHKLFGHVDGNTTPFLLSVKHVALMLLPRHAGAAVLANTRTAPKAQGAKQRRPKLSCLALQPANYLRRRFESGVTHADGVPHPTRTVNQKHVIRISMKTPWLSAILRFATETRLASEPPPSAPTPV